MELDLNVLRPQERASLQLRLLYEQEGFRKYHMGRFEEYGLYQENRRFLSSEQVITFTDLDGRLLALKPDVTLSIAKNAQVGPGGCGRYYYQENVYRPSQESHTFREISQMGLECIGAVDDAAAAQVVSLALRSLALTGRDFVLEISHMGFVTGLFDAVGAQEAVRPGSSPVSGTKTSMSCAKPLRPRASPARGRTHSAAWGLWQGPGRRFLLPRRCWP